MALRPPLRVTLAGTAMAAAGLALVPATRAQDGQCQKLQQSYQQEFGSAESLKSKAAQQAMQSGSSVLSNFGIQLGFSGKAQEAIQKGRSRRPTRRCKMPSLSSCCRPMRMCSR